MISLSYVIYLDIYVLYMCHSVIYVLWNGTSDVRKHLFVLLSLLLNVVNVRFVFVHELVTTPKLKFKDEVHIVTLRGEKGELPAGNLIFRLRI